MIVKLLAHVDVRNKIVFHLKCIIIFSETTLTKIWEFHISYMYVHDCHIG